MAAKELALVTGASAGIGQAIARALARDGYDLVLVARDQSRLEAFAKELDGHYGTRSEVLPADLCAPDELARVEARIGAEPVIDVVVNNAGFGTFGRFYELPVDNEVRQVQLNIVALLRCTHAAAVAMVARGRGRILNVSSIAGAQPIPGNATYSGTKAFVTNFGESLHEELRGTGVTLTTLCPGFTRTEFQERSGFDPGRVPSFAWQNADEVATVAVEAMKKGRATVVPGALNKVTAAVSYATPHAITRRIAGSVIRHS
jgi:short-subunit dehydrogenase